MACRHEFVTVEAPCGHMMVTECVVCGVMIRFEVLPVGRGGQAMRAAYRMPDGSRPPADVVRLVDQFLRDVEREVGGVLLPQLGPFPHRASAPAPPPSAAPSPRR